MRYILAPVSRDVLEQFACSKVLLALDFDGTLAPIVRGPSRARMRASTRRLLRQVARLYPCVVISGRARVDVLERVRGVGVVEVIGSHGIESWHTSGRVLRKVRRWRSILERRLARLKGVAIEDTGLSLAIHYRRSREKTTARAAIQAAARLLGAVRLIPGKQVLNVLPQEGGNKGTALEKARARLGCDTALYVGDDDTDEDVFALDRPGRLLAIRVGRKRASRAAYYIRNQGEIDILLRDLLAFRRQHRGPAARG
jgi:trehalose 6-phosphate phosphatase